MVIIHLGAKTHWPPRADGVPDEVQRRDQHVSARPDLGAVTALAMKKMFPHRFPGLVLLGWR